MEITPIRHENTYHGFRVRLNVHLDGAVIPFQVDVGFGDSIVPEAEDVIFPVLIDGEPPTVRAYPREASLAEKLHAMVAHGELNSRYKDFFDVWVLSSRFAFRGERIAAAVQATFTRRQSASFSPWPVALTPAFYSDPVRRVRWTHFLNRSRLDQAPADFERVGERMIEFFGPPVRGLSSSEHFSSAWPSGGGWA